MATQTAQLNYLMITPRKVRLIANTIRGLSIQEAEAQLLLRPQRASDPLLKLLRSAVANAKNNQNLNPDTLKISTILVDPAPSLKRSLPRSMGRATPILKRMCHVTLVLSDAVAPKKNRFVINPPVKKAPKKDEAKKGEKVKGDVQPKPEHKIAGKEEKSVAKPKTEAGKFKRFFNRKSV